MKQQYKSLQVHCNEVSIWLNYFTIQYCDWVDKPDHMQSDTPTGVYWGCLYYKHKQTNCEDDDFNRSWLLLHALPQHHHLTLLQTHLHPVSYSSPSVPAPHTSFTHAVSGPSHLANHYASFKTKLKLPLSESLPWLPRWGSSPAPAALTILVMTVSLVSGFFL